MKSFLKFRRKKPAPTDYDEIDSLASTHCVRRSILRSATLESFEKFHIGNNLSPEVRLSTQKFSERDDFPAFLCRHPDYFITATQRPDPPCSFIVFSPIDTQDNSVQQESLPSTKSSSHTIPTPIISPSTSCPGHMVRHSSLRSATSPTVHSDFSSMHTSTSCTQCGNFQNSPNEIQWHPPLDPPLPPPSLQETRQPIDPSEKDDVPAFLRRRPDSGMTVPQSGMTQRPDPPCSFIVFSPIDTQDNSVQQESLLSSKPPSHTIPTPNISPSTSCPGSSERLLEAILSTLSTILEQQKAVAASPMIAHDTRTERPHSLAPSECPTRDATVESETRHQEEDRDTSFENDADDDEEIIQGTLLRQKSFRITAERHFTDVLTVFQATPLVYLDVKNRPYPVAAVDVQHERKVLSKTLEGSSIAVAFEVATTNQLGAFLAKGRGCVLHFSCHGRAEYLAVEDGWGAVHNLDVEHLKSWIALGGKRLQLVFVSACHSRSIGQAFVDAGVPHVVCCSHDSHSIVSNAAVKFESVFYGALAHGNVLQKAFDLAQGEIMVWPGLPSQQRMEESRKYCLLPEGKHANHDVQVFSTGDSTMPHWQTPQSSIASLTKKFPPLPEPFVVRQVAQFQVLQKLKSSRLVRVAGPPKIGKSSLVKACCQWISERRHDFDFHEIVWVPFSQDNNGYCFTRWFEDMFEKASLETYSVGSFREYCTSPLQNISQYLRSQCKGALLVFEAKHLSQAGVAKLTFFVVELLKRTSENDKDVKVIIIGGEADRVESMVSPGFSVAESLVEVPKLGLEETIELFARTCPHVANKIHRRIIGQKALVDHLMPTSLGSRLSKRQATTIIQLLGEGNPGKVLKIANQMSVEEFERLVAIGDQEEVEIPLESRAKLINRAHELEKDIASACNFRYVAGEQKLRSEKEQIMYHLERMPNLNAMEMDLDIVNFEIRVSRSKGDCFELGKLETKRFSLDNKIKAEKEAMGALGMLEAHEAFAQQFQTRAHIDVKMNKLEQKLVKMTDIKDFDGAKAVKAERVDLDELKPLRPTQKALSTYVSQLEARLIQATSSELYDTANEIHARLQEVKMKLASERKAVRELSIAEMQVAPAVARSCLKDPPRAVNEDSGADVSSGKSESIIQDGLAVGNETKQPHAVTARGANLSDRRLTTIMATEIPIENEKSHSEKSDESLTNAPARINEGIKIEATMEAVEMLTASTSSETGQRNHLADSPLSPLEDVDDVLHTLESQMDLEEEVENYSVFSCAHTVMGQDSMGRACEVLPGAIRVGRNDSNYLSKLFSHSLTEDEETCFGETCFEEASFLTSATIEIQVPSAFHVDHDPLVEQLNEQLERFQNMPVVAAVELTNLRDADNDSSTDDVIKTRRCLGRLVQGIRSIMRFRSKRK